MNAGGDYWQAINTGLLIVLAAIQALTNRRVAKVKQEAIDRHQDVKDVAREATRELTDTLREIEHERMDRELRSRP